MDEKKVALPRFPDSLKPRIRKYTKLFEDGGIPEEEIADLFGESLRCVIEIACRDERLAASLRKRIPGLVGKKFFRQTRGQRPHIMEVRHFPEVLDLRLAKEGEVERQKLPGIIFTRDGSQELIVGSGNPLKALARKRMKIVRTARFIPWGINLLWAFEPLLVHGGGEVRERIIEALVPILDGRLRKLGC
ncbi:hypothetical protein ACFL4G_11285 [Thermodesulfobacteriota bacterium]